VLAERFRRYLLETPIAYLTRWRLQLGAQMLKSTSSSVAQIAAEVGYESEPAFNRAFKREFGLPPARFRNQAKLARSNPSATYQRKVAAVQNDELCMPFMLNFWLADYYRPIL
jgi:AraC-like DNA-binding protein